MLFCNTETYKKMQTKAD